MQKEYEEEKQKAEVVSLMNNYGKRMKESWKEEITMKKVKVIKKIRKQWL